MQAFNYGLLRNFFVTLTLTFACCFESLAECNFPRSSYFKSLEDVLIVYLVWVMKFGVSVYKLCTLSG